MTTLRQAVHEYIRMRRHLGFKLHEPGKGLLAFVRPSLEATGDWVEVSEIVHATLAQGTGAHRQREAFARTGRLEDVVDEIVTETARGTA